MHFQQNLACQPTVFVSSFDYYDPGTGQAAQQLFGLDQGVVAATLGELGVNVLGNIKIPNNVAKGAFFFFLPVFLVCTYLKLLRRSRVFRPLQHRPQHLQLYVRLLYPPPTIRC